MSESLKHKTTQGVLWSFVERFSVQGIQFVIMIVMARLLSPSDYGLIGMLAVFLAVSQSLIDSGFSQALIRKQNRTETDNNTVFYFNIVVGFILYAILYFVAPLVAKFYDTPQLCSVMRVVCISVVLNSFAVVQRALLTVRIDFKTQAKAALTAAIISGIVVIALAYNGFGVWSLVWQQLLNLGINTILLWMLTKWRPQKVYSWTSFRELFSFGSKMLASGLLDTLYRNIYPIVIGKLFSANNLGHYTRAHHFAEFPSSNLTGILQRVTYPVLCEIQHDDNRLSNIYRRFLKLSAYLIFPLMVGLSAVAQPLVNTVLGSRWSFCGQLLQVICFAMMWYPVHAINLNLLQVKGRSDLFLKLEIIKKVMGISVLCLTAPFGLLIMCYGQIANSMIALIINTYYTGKLIHIGFLKQMHDLFPTLLLCLAMFALVFVVNHFVENDIRKLCSGIGTGGVFYLTASRLLHFSEIDELLAILKRK